MMTGMIKDLGLNRFGSAVWGLNRVLNQVIPILPKGDHIITWEPDEEPNDCHSIITKIEYFPRTGEGQEKLLHRELNRKDNEVLISVYKDITVIEGTAGRMTHWVKFEVSLGGGWDFVLLGLEADSIPSTECWATVDEVAAKMEFPDTTVGEKRNWVIRKTLDDLRKIEEIIDTIL